MLNRLHTIFSFRRHFWAIAVVQLLVMVMFAVPVCCYELEPDHEKAGISQSAKSNDAEQNKCPCCPNENKADSANCSTCGYCSYHGPLTTVNSTDYIPSTAQLVSREQFSMLPDVYIPIFVPPQNLA
jgi:hypothetical protein